MFPNLLIFILAYFFILISLLGYGLAFSNIFLKNKNFNNIGYLGLLGIFTLIIYSYLSNFFIAHTKIHNLILLLLGFIFFCVFFNKDKVFFRQNIYLTLIIFSLIFISILIFKSHDDFPYYHFPYTHYLTEQNSIIGIGKLNHGFRTPSSLFYLNSLFYIPILDYNLFNFGQIYILGFGNIILIKNINNNYLSLKKNFTNFNIINFLSLLSFIFINIFFYRIAEHGTDRSAQILIFIFIIEIIYLLINKKNYSIQIINILLLLSLIISLKAFYILYIIFLLPIFIFFILETKNFKKALQVFISNSFIIWFILMLNLVLLSYFFNTGCLIYPISFTCFQNLSWTISTSEIKLMNQWYELWSKAGASPNYRVENPLIYLSDLNWLNTWVDNYFFNKVSDFILGLVFLISFVLFFLKGNLKLNLKSNKNKYILYVFLLIILLLFEWFFNHPALRYGGYCLVALLLFLPCSLFFRITEVKQKLFSKKILILIIITTLIFITRNIQRIDKEIKLYGYKPFSNTFYRLDENYFRIQKEIDDIIINKTDDFVIKYWKIIFVKNK